MARPRKRKSVDAQSAAGAGEHLETGGRITVSIFVVARNFDSANDSLAVSLEISPDGEYWADTERLASNEKASIQGSDLEDHDGDGDYTAALSVQGVAAQYVRANVVEFTDAANGDLDVDAWVSITNNPAGAHNYREV